MSFRRFFIPVDGSSNSLLACKMAVRLAEIGDEHRDFDQGAEVGAFGLRDSSDLVPYRLRLLRRRSR